MRGGRPGPGTRRACSSLVSLAGGDREVPAGEVLPRGGVEALEFFGDVGASGACLESGQRRELGRDPAGGLPYPVVRVAPVAGQERLLLGGELDRGLVVARAVLAVGLAVLVFGLAGPCDGGGGGGGGGGRLGDR